jgi:hypothetical protein
MRYLKIRAEDFTINQFSEKILTEMFCIKDFWTLHKYFKPKSDRFKLYNNSRLTQEGRRLLPKFNVLIDNLDPSSTYDIYLDFIERARYAWIKSNWVKIHDVSSDIDSYNCECLEQHQSYLHKDSPNSGRFWMANPVSFARVKVTSRTQDFTSDQVGSNLFYIQERFS